MAKKRNFNYEKRKRELRKQKKVKEKLEARRARRAGGAGEAKADSVADVENGAKADVHKEAEGLDPTPETPDS